MKRAPDFYRSFPNAHRQCGTCAFNPNTDSWRGFDTTSLGLVRSLLRDEPFYCHDNLPKDPKTGDWMFDRRIAKLCAGAEIVRCGEAKHEIVRAFSGSSSTDAARLDDGAQLLARSLPELEARTCVQTGKEIE